MQREDRSGVAPAGVKPAGLLQLEHPTQACAATSTGNALAES